jgi:Global regulator protein family
MLTNLSTGDKIHIGDSITLTILAIEGDLVRFKIESSEPDSPPFHCEGNAASDCSWWRSN